MIRRAISPLLAVALLLAAFAPAEAGPLSRLFGRKERAARPAADAGKGEAAAPSRAIRRAPADGSGTVELVPKTIPADTLLNLSVLVRGTSPDQNIAEVALTLPWAWSFSGKAEDVTLAGSGFAFARVETVTGSGHPGSPYRVRIVGVSINPTKLGEIRVAKLRSPAFAAAAANPVNQFNVETLGEGGVWAPVAAQQGVATTGGGRPRLLINEIATRDANDFIELVCLDDGNGGAGNDLAGFTLTEAGSATPDKAFGSVVVRSGDYVVLTYGSTASDETISANGRVDLFTVRSGLPDADGQVRLIDPDGRIVDALPYADMDGFFAGYGAMLALIDGGQWGGVNEIDCFDARLNAAGRSIQRNVHRLDTNRPDDFELSTRPTKGAENRYAGVPYRIVIQEVAPGYPGGDFIELLVVDDGRGGLGLDLAGFTLTADSGRFRKEFGALAVRTGDLVLVRFNASSADATAASAGLATLHTPYAGLNQIEGGIALTTPRLATADYMAYSRAELSAETRDSVAAAIAARAWQDSPPFGLADRLDCVDIATMTSGMSIARARYGQDTDTKHDFALTTLPTPGAENGAPQVLHRLALVEGESLALRTGVERKLTLRALDAAGAVVKTATHRIRIASDSATARLSATGMAFADSIEKNLFDGELSFFVRDPSPGSFRLHFDALLTDAPRHFVDVSVQAVLSVKINEIQYNPSPQFTTHPEYAIWIELRNGESVARDLSGYQMESGGRRFAFPAGTIIPAYGYLIYCRHLERKNADDPPALADLWGDRDGTWRVTDGFHAVADPLLRIPAPGTVSLLTPEGQGVSIVSFEPAMGGNGTGRSLERQEFAVESFGALEIDRYNFVPSGDNEPNGTPGRQNSRDLSDPNTLAIIHTPVTSHNILHPLTIHAEVRGATKVELFFREAENVIYRVREMARIDGTSVYRAVIEPDEVLTDRLQYYIRAGDGRNLVWHPTGGEAAPLSVSILDERNMTWIETPVKTVGENEAFLIRVRLRNQKAKIANLDYEVAWDASLFTPTDTDAARPGIQAEIPTAFSGYFVSVNEADAATGRARVAFENPSGSVTGDPTLFTLRFKSLKTVADAQIAQTTIRLEKAEINGARVDSRRDGTVYLDRATEWVVGREGGTITAAHGAELSIPQNALLQPTGIRIRKLALDEIPKTNVLDSNNGITATRIAFEFLPAYTEFRRPVTMRLPFTTTELQFSKIADSANLRIFFWNHRTLAWERVGGRVENGKVAVEISHFTIYLLVDDRRTLAPQVDRIEFKPNPFSPNGNGWNDTTALSFHLANNAEVTVHLFDARGVTVRKLVEKRPSFAGINQVEWDGRDDFGRMLRAGIYLYKLKAVEADRIMVKNQGTVVLSPKMKDW